MQINSICNVQNNPNFTGFRVYGGPKSIDKIMDTFNGLSTPDLIRAKQIVSRAEKNPISILLEDLSWVKPNRNGHILGSVGAKEYEKGAEKPLTGGTFIGFLKKLTKEAEKFGFGKMSNAEADALARKEKIELAEAKKAIKKGGSEEKIRDNALDQIFNTIRTKI